MRDIFEYSLVVEFLHRYEFNARIGNIDDFINAEDVQCVYHNGLMDNMKKDGDRVFIFTKEHLFFIELGESYQMKFANYKLLDIEEVAVSFDEERKLTLIIKFRCNEFEISIKEDGIRGCDKEFREQIRNVFKYLSGGGIVNG